MIYLPPEIWSMVINNLDDSTSLFNLCRVSKALYEIATPQLYESPCTRCDNRRYTRQEFFRTLIESPHLASLVTRLPAGFDRIFIHRRDLSPAVEDVFNRHVVALLSSTYSMPQDDVTTRDDINDFIKTVIRPWEYIPATFCRTVLVSLLPNLSEMRLLDPNDQLLSSIQPGALPELKKVVFEEDHELEFGILRCLARAAPYLDSLSFMHAAFTSEPPWKEDWETPLFPAVTKLNLDGVFFAYLETSAKALVLSFPVLQSFRFQGQEQLDGPSLKMIKNLLKALRNHAPQLKHLYLGGAHGFIPGAPTSRSAWPRTLKMISSFTSLETLGIDDYSLWPFDCTGPSPSSLVDYLPHSLLHLHLGLLGVCEEEKAMDLSNMQTCISTLARAILQEGKFKCLKIVSFSSNYTNEDLSEALKAMDEAGVPMIRQDSPWGRDGLYDDN